MELPLRNALTIARIRDFRASLGGHAATPSASFRVGIWLDGSASIALGLACRAAKAVAIKQSAMSARVGTRPQNEETTMQMSPWPRRRAESDVSRTRAYRCR